MRNSEIKFTLESMYDVSDVRQGFIYWFNRFLDVALDMFKYKGLPHTLPAREIEINLLLYGNAPVFIVDDRIITCASSLYGEDDYYNPLNITYAQPRLNGGIRTIGVDCEVIYNDNLQYQFSGYIADAGLRSFIARYARLMSDIESSISIYTVNTRINDILTASNDNVKASLKKFYDSVEIGKREIIVDEPIIESLKAYDRPQRIGNDKITDLLTARDKVLEMFYRDLGVKMYQPKKAQVTDDEVYANEQILLISTDDMLRERREGVERVNRMFGLSISVDINEKFVVSNFDKGGVDNALQKNK